MNKKRHQIIFEIAFTAILIALIAALSAPPYIGFGLAIPFLGVQPTILHIPVIIGAFLLGRKYAWLLGLVFGLGSLWAAITINASLAVLVFQNPLISVLPRIIFGVAAYEIFRLFTKLIKNTVLAIITSAILATLLHSILVTLSILLFGALLYQDIEVFINTFLLPAVSFNSLVEIILAGLVVLPIYKALKNVMNQPVKE